MRDAKLDGRLGEAFVERPKRMAGKPRRHEQLLVIPTDATSEKPSGLNEGQAFLRSTVVAQGRRRRLARVCSRLIKLPVANSPRTTGCMEISAFSRARGKLR